MGPQRCRLTPEQIDTPEAVFHVAQESQPGGTTGVLSRPVVMGENPANHVFVDFDVERQRRSVGRFTDSPSGDYVASFPTTTRMSSARGPFGPGLRRRFGEKSIRYFRLLMALSRPSRVEGFTTIAVRSRRVGRIKNAIQPARMRSHADRMGDRCRERFTIRSWCLRRSDSATIERTPPGPSKRARVAIKWMKRTTKLRITES